MYLCILLIITFALERTTMGTRLLRQPGLGPARDELHQYGWAIGSAALGSRGVSDKLLDQFGHSSPRLPPYHPTAITERKGDLVLVSCQTSEDVHQVCKILQQGKPPSNSACVGTKSKITVTEHRGKNQWVYVYYTCGNLCDLSPCSHVDEIGVIDEMVWSDGFVRKVRCRCKAYEVRGQGAGYSCKEIYDGPYDLTDPCFYSNPRFLFPTATCLTRMSVGGRAIVCRIYSEALTKSITFRENCPESLTDHWIAFQHEGQNIRMDVCSSKCDAPRCRRIEEVAVTGYGVDEWILWCRCEEYYYVADENKIRCSKLLRPEHRCDTILDK